MWKFKLHFPFGGYEGIVLLFVFISGIAAFLLSGLTGYPSLMIAIPATVMLHRQEKDLASKHIPLLKATMSNWVGNAAEKWCMPIVEEMHRMLLAGEVIHADETRIQVLHEEGRKATAESKMWVYCNGKLNDHSIVIFDYKPTRKGENAQAFLKGFDGERCESKRSAVFNRCNGSG